MWVMIGVGDAVDVAAAVGEVVGEKATDGVDVAVGSAMGVGAVVGAATPTCHSGSRASPGISLHARRCRILVR